MDQGYQSSQAQQGSQSPETFIQMPALGGQVQDILTRVIKYVVEGLAVAVVAYLLPQKKMSLQEVAMLGLTAAAIFAILDLYAPSVAAGTRQGAGFGIGASLVSFPGVPLPGGGMLPGVPAL